MFSRFFTVRLKRDERERARERERKERKQGDKEVGDEESLSEAAFTSTFI